MRLTRGWCLSEKSPTPAWTYLSLPRIRKKVSVSTVASAARKEAALMAICPVAEKTFPSASPSCFLRSESWTSILCSSPPRPFCLRRPLMYRVGPSGDWAAVLTPDEAVYLIDQQGQEDHHDEEQHHNQSHVGERDGEGAFDQAVALLEPVHDRVEHRRKEQGDDEPAHEGPDLPQEE